MWVKKKELHCCITLPLIATHCNTLRHTATGGEKKAALQQRTATHCNSRREQLSTFVSFSP